MSSNGPPSGVENRARQQARTRAFRRLAAAYPEVWRALYAEELREVVKDPRYAGAFDHQQREPQPRKKMTR